MTYRRAAAALVVSVLAMVWAGSALGASSTIVVSQVYGGGGNSGATLKNDFIELHNVSASPVNVTGWSVQYAATTGTSWQRTDLSGTIPAGGFYLVQQAAGAGGTVDLPTPDAAGNIAMGATNGKVVLLNVATTITSGTSCPSGSTVIDVVGFGTTTNCAEGTPTANLSNVTAALRNEHGCVDTDNNSADFTIAAPAPRNSAAPVRICGDVAPTVSSTVPVDGATGVEVDASITVSFSEPVDVADGWYLISCPITGGHPASVTGGPSSYVLDPIVDFAQNETCSVTIAGALVTDRDGTPDPMAANYAFSFATAGGPTGGGDVVVGEVYGGGGNSGATYKNDFIELYNRTAASVSLAGWSVQYASTTGSTWQVTPLSGSIAPGGRYLIQEAQGAGGTVDLPTPDAVGTIAMAAGAGKVALVAATTALSGSCPTSAAIVDFVGYGSGTNCFEGSGPTPTISATVSAHRKNGGAEDTDDNAADFVTGAPTPQPGPDQAPTVAATVPASGATGVALGANLTITFSEPVNVAGSWFTIACSTSGAHTAAVSGGPTTYTLDPDVDLVAEESCTVTIVAANVTDVDSNDPPDAMVANHVFSFETAAPLVCGGPATKIHAVQGNGLVSPVVGTGATIEGVVVGDYQTGGFDGFYLQEESADADADPATSEGIFVYAPGTIDVAVGDVVRARGTVEEFFSLTQLSSVNAIAVCSTGATVAPTAVSLPVADVNDHERFEGMLVDLNQPLTVTEVFTLARFGEVSLSGAGRLYTPTAVTTPGAAAQAVALQNARSRIVLDDGLNTQNPEFVRYPQGGLSATNTLRVGDSLASLRGVMDYRFSLYRVQPVGDISFAKTNPRTPAPAPVGGNLKVASFNVLNYFNGNGLGGGFPTSRGANSLFELQRQHAKIVSALTAMDADVVGLMEIENDAGPNSALADLVAGLNAATAPGTYALIDTGVIGTDEIKVALIYKPAKVTPSGTWRILTSAVDPRFIDTLNRPALAQTFQSTTTGQKLTVAVNHLKSKGSACAGDPDTGDGSGNCNGTRTNAAAALADWLATDPTGSGDPDFLIIGDLNAYTFETPITTLVNRGYTNLVRAYGGLTAYSYVFNGESGYLDHALATASLTAQVTGVTDWHINPDEPIALDYNVEFKSPAQVASFYDPGPYRASDHDPVVIGIQLNSGPTANAGGPYTVGEGGTVGVSATGTDPDGDSLTYAWDLDNDGTFETAGQNATFSAAGIDGPATRTIRVRASDGDLTHVASTTVTITNVAPTATFNAPASAYAGLAFELSLTNPSDPSAADTAAGFTYAFDCGSGFGPYGGSSSTSCTSTSLGPLTVRGKIRDKDGGESTYTATVSIIVTFASLQTLTSQYVTDPTVAASLNDKLIAAADADARGNQGAKRQALNAYVNQVKAQTGKTITAEQAEILVRLARAL